MKRWEYKCESVGTRQSLMAIMLACGADGWEAIQIVDSFYGRAIYFKRELPAPTPSEGGGK